MTNNHLTLEYTCEALDRVLAECVGVRRDKFNRNFSSHQDLEEMDPRSRLVQLLDGLSGRNPIVKSKVERALKDEFYRCLNPYIGGLTREAYRIYAYRCVPVMEAAQYHRDHFASAEMTEQQPTTEA